MKDSNNSSKNLPSKLQLLIKNGDCYLSGVGFKKGNIVVNDGKIVSLLSNNDIIDSSFERVIDCAGLKVLPGMMDSHTHMREPGRTDREDFSSGTKAAAAGGITCVFDMPNVSPPVYDSDILKNRIKLAEAKAFIDVKFYGGAGFNNIENQQALADAGAAAFKTFIQPLPQGREEEFIGITALDEAQISAILTNGARISRRFFFHCESHQHIAEMEKTLHEQGVSDYSFHYRSRPSAAEIEAVQMIIRIAEKTGAKVGISHISVPEACECVKNAKKAGIDIVAETCFHYLLFDSSYIDKLGPYAKCNPPLRSRAEVEGIWSYLLDGTIDCIGSDHAPLLKSEKDAGLANIRLAYSGLPSVEVMLPLMLDQVSKGRLTLEKLVELMSVNTAKIFNVFPAKGSIAEGSDADFTVVDMNRYFRLSTDKMHTKNKKINILFEGREGFGMPVFTVSHGEVIVEDGRVACKKK